jgi:hypothetical protein
VLYLLRLIFLIFIYLFTNHLVLPDWTVWAQTDASDVVNPESYKRELLFSEDFSQDLSQWQILQGQSSDWQIIDGWLRGEAWPTFYHSELLPETDIWQQHWQHYLYQFDFKISSGVDVNWSWGVENQSNWYQAHFNHHNLHLVRVRNDQQVLNIFKDFFLELDRVYRVKIYFNHGHIQLWIDDQLIVDRQDHRYELNGGPISLRVSSGMAAQTQVWFDNLEVYALAPEIDTELPVPAYKQHDDRWKDEEYDQAEDWSDNPTIRRWGCALTSLAMVMRYHDLQYLPNGQLLTPESLNTWLKQQPDGYIQGGVNWLAGTRLSRLISEEHSIRTRIIPTLEYARISTSDISQATDIIEDNRPVILQIPGHFLVANGFTSNQSDLLIEDPAYIYDRFSQHDQPLLSLIDLQPSYTDLSYMLLVYPLGLEVDVLDNEGLSVADQELSLDNLIDQVSLELKSDQMVTHLVPQPTSADYQLKISAKQPQFYQLGIYFYDQDGNFRYLERTGYLDFDATDQTVAQQTHSFSYDHDQLSLVEFKPEVEPDFEDFLQHLSQARDQHHLDRSYIFRQLNFLAQQAISLGANQDQELARYRQLILKLLQQWQGLIQPEAMSLLLSTLN